MSGLRAFWVGLSLVFSLAVAAAFIAPMFGVDFTNQYLYMPVTLGGAEVNLGAVLLVGSAAFALIGLILAFVTGGGRGTALLALIIPVALIAYLQFGSGVQSLDIQPAASVQAPSEEGPTGTIEFTPTIVEETAQTPPETPAETPPAPQEPAKE